MEDKHTSEPWELKYNSYEDSMGIRQKDQDENWSFWIVEKMRDEDDTEDKEINSANANRIIECVNAMQGIENPIEWIKTVQAVLKQEGIEIFNQSPPSGESGSKPTFNFPSEPLSETQKTNGSE